MTSSESLMQGLSQVVRCPISFVCVINFLENDHFFCLGQHSFFLIKKNLEEINCEIYLAHIDYVFLDEYRYNVLQIQFSDNRDNKIPAKMNFITDDRMLFINHLSSAWKTDYMFRKGSIKNMPLFKVDLTDQIKELDNENKTLLPSFLTDPYLYVQLKRHELNGYCFFLFDAFQKQKEVGVYMNSQNNCKVFLQITDPMPMEFISLLRDREDLKFYSQVFLDSIMGERKDFWIISSGVYLKRNNLTLDSAQWSGWEIRIREPKKETLILMLRRKYIPPMMDVFQDIAIVMSGPILEKSDPKILAEYLSHIRNMADSFYSVNTLHTISPNSIYKLLIEEKANGLLLDDDSYFFLQYKRDIKPKQISFGIKYLSCILKILAKQSDEYEKLERELTKRYENELSADAYGVKGIKEDDPTLLVNEFLKLSYQGTDIPKKKMWMYKLSRYLAYCVDGGLLNGQFSLVEILYHFNSSSSGAKILKVINFLLHLTPEKGEIELEFFSESTKVDISSIISKMKKINSGTWIFNERVMKTLIENDFFFTEFKKMADTTGESAQGYADVLIQLLLISKSSALKCSICRHLISFQAELKSKEKEVDDEYMKAVFKILNKPLIELYKSNNKTLATLACVALLNICWNSKEIKFLIVFEGGGHVALQNLSSRDETLLRYSLQLVMSLCSIYQNIENFIKGGLINKLLAILAGTKVPGTAFSVKVISLVLQILRIIVGQTDSKFNDIERSMKGFLISLEQEYVNCDDVEIELIGLLKKMALKNINCKKTIGEIMIKNILEKMAKKQAPLKNPKVLDQYLQLLCILVKENDSFFVEEIFKNDGRAIIKDYLEKTKANPGIHSQLKFLSQTIYKKY